MKIFVDDVRIPPDPTWHVWRDVSSAIRALDKFWEQITHISLDHDISHLVMMGGTTQKFPCRETFEPVARYIARLNEVHQAWQPIIILHTSNPQGAKNMQEILDQVGLPATIQIATGEDWLE